MARWARTMAKAMTMAGNKEGDIEGGKSNGDGEKREMATAVGGMATATKT
jgi:hypothetical protein